MAQAFVSIGSNMDPVRHLRSGISDLRAVYGKLILSPVYESHAMGFSGNNFYNLVAAFVTERDARAVGRSLRQIEQQNGRERSGERFSNRSLDLDLLLYDDLVLQEAGLSLPRDEILKYAFVLRPLSDIYPTGKHPVTGQRYLELWQGFDKSSQPLWSTDVRL